MGAGRDPRQRRRGSVTTQLAIKPPSLLWQKEWGRGQVSGEVKMRPVASIWGDPEDLGSNTMKPIAGGLFTPLFNKYFLSDYFVMDAGATAGE